MKRFAKIGLLLMSIVLMILPVVFGLMLYLETKGAINDSFLDSKKSKSSLRDKPVDPSLDHVSVLFLGVDDSTSRREGGQKANQSRTDAMIYTTFNRDKKQIRMVSIPRDTLSYIPAVKYYDKITHAHAIDGPEGSMESVESTLNVPVDYYARINMEAFVEVVDELGGIEYNVPFDLNEPNTEDKGRIKVKKGKRNLSGDEALAVVRSRKQDSDLERGKRQMEMIKAQETNSINKLDDLVKIVGKNAKHNFSFEDIQNLATTYSSSKVKIKTEQVTGTDANFNGVYFFNPDLDNLLELSNKLRKDLNLPKTKKTELMNYLMIQAYGDLTPYIEVSKKSLKSGNTSINSDSAETVEPAIEPDTEESTQQQTEQPSEQPVEQPIEQAPSQEVPQQEVPQQATPDQSGQAPDQSAQQPGPEVY